MTPTCCSVTEFAASWGVSRPTIAKRIAEGMPVIKADSNNLRVRINPADANQWLLQRERERYNPEDGSKSLAAERLRLISEQADREALENACRRGEVIVYAVAEEVVAGLASLIVSRLDGLGGRLANELVNEPNPAVIRDKILAECRAIRQELADAAEGLGRHYQDLKKASANPDNVPHH
jgi:phage terminase Nu1 subunit (DNA packaging protein)